MRLWEQALLQTKPVDMSLAYDGTLADLFASVEPEHTRVGDYIRRGPRALNADGWTWDAANWNLASLVAGQPFRVDELSIPLRPDTENSVMVWDAEHLWTHTWTAASPDKGQQNKSIAGQGTDAPECKTRPYRAALRVDVAMKSLHALPVPLVTLRPRVSRLSNTASSARTAWLAPRSPTPPAMPAWAWPGTASARTWSTPDGLPWTPGCGSRKARLSPGCGYGRVPARQDLSGQPGNFGALVPFSTKSPIGRSVGVHTVAALAEHCRPSPARNSCAGAASPRRPVAVRTRTGYMRTGALGAGAWVTDQSPAVLTFHGSTSADGIVQSWPTEKLYR